MKKVMVTGSAGFIGSALCQTLQDQGYQVIPIDRRTCDLSTPQSLEALLEFQGDQIIHLAGKTQVPQSWEDPLAFYRANVDTTATVLEYARLSKTPVVFVSAYVYGIPDSLPISEKMIPKPNNPYAHSKWLAEQLCHFYYSSFSVPVIIARPFNIYGLGQSPQFFISSLLQQLKDKGRIQLADLSPSRDYLYLDDFINGLIALMNAGQAGEIYNLGSGVSHSCRAVVEILESLLQIKLSVHDLNTSRINEIPEVLADISKIQAHTNWSPAFSLEEGLKHLIEATNVYTH